MPETVGNEANYKNGATAPSIEFGINVLATQATVESDSFDNQYDANAWMEVAETPAIDAEGAVNVWTAEQLAGVMSNVDGIKTINIMENIDLSGRTWTPANFWDPENTALLTINGNGHTISNMVAASGKNVGFIGSNSRNITINDLTFENAIVTTPGSFAGTVIGYAYGNITLNNVDVVDSVVTGSSVSGSSVSIRIGGLIGFIPSDAGTLTLADCDVNGSEIAGYHNVGAMVGTTMTNKTVTIESCSATNNTLQYASSKVGAFAFGASTSGYTEYVPTSGFTAETNELVAVVKSTDLYAEDADGDLISFEPIGSYRYDTAFKGMFDGQGHTIYNMYQNGWDLNNEYYMSDLGLGLFGLVEDATIKDLKIDGANQPSEFNLIGSVAGAAYGECVFENITVTNSYMGNHSYYSGGIVGWASGDHKYINCDLDASNVISSQWGDFNNANGGIIGGAGKSGSYYFEDCDVACVIDAYNDVTSACEWYAYRNAGMLIGNSGHTQTIDGTTYAAAPNLTCVNCTVTYGEWANYHYCQFNAMGYPWVRVEAGESCHAYGNARYDYAVDANGNNVVDENHVHNDGEGHNNLIVFDQLFGGSQGGVYGTATHDGVTVIYNNK